MIKRFLLLIFLLPALSFAQSTNWFWTGAAADNLWTNEANWFVTNGYPNSDNAYVNGSFSAMDGVTIDQPVTFAGAAVTNKKFRLDPTARLTLKDINDGIFTIDDQSGFSLNLNGSGGVNVESDIEYKRLKSGSFFSDDGDWYSTTNRNISFTGLIVDDWGDTISSWLDEFPTNSFKRIALTNGSIRVAGLVALDAIITDGIILNNAGIRYDKSVEHTVITVLEGASSTNVIWADNNTRSQNITGAIGGACDTFIFRRNDGSDDTNDYIRLSGINTYTDTSTRFEGGDGNGSLGYGIFQLCTNNIVPSGDVEFDPYCWIEWLDDEALNSSVDLYIESGAKLYGAATGVITQTVRSLFIDDVSQAPATWGGTGSGAANINDDIFANSNLVINALYEYKKYFVLDPGGKIVKTPNEKVLYYYRYVN